MLIVDSFAINEQDVKGIERNALWKTASPAVRMRRQILREI